MIKQYNDLFRLAPRHSFYADGKARDLVLAPAPATLRLMERYDLRWGQDENGYVLVYGRESSNPPRLSWLGEPLALRFFLRSKHPYFLNITDVPFYQPGKQILYFDNLRAAAAAQPFALSSSAITGGADLLPVYPSGFEFEPSGGNILSLRDARNRVLAAAAEVESAAAGAEQTNAAPDTFMPPERHEPVWAPLPNTAVQGRFRINLSGLPPGKYGLETAPDQVSWFFFGGQEIRPADLGVADVYIGTASASMVPPPLAAGGLAAPPRQFQIAFEARTTRWRYFLINRNRLAFDQIEVNDGKTALGFQAMESRPLPGGTETAIPLLSDAAFPLRERPEWRYKLKLSKNNGNGAASGIPVTLDLPSPDWRRITPEGRGAEQQVYSDMYIYL
ncbi:MAG: hypothetical protein L6Q97_02105 [Thermoanaerobaculia bacterium]|nr:hypothetical protein [Thermoanaerobaculia bacterium]